MSNTETSRIYNLPNRITAQNVAYALAEYLDEKRNMITQTMRTRYGYSVQCKGDASANWTKYLGMNAAVGIHLAENNGRLKVTIGTEQWAEKAGFAAAGLFLFQPLILTAGIGALRQLALPATIFNFIENYLGEAPLAEVGTQAVICPHCGAENKKDAQYCKTCGQDMLSSDKEYVCPDCGEELDGDELFCPRCGSKLRN